MSTSHCSSCQAVKAPFTCGLCQGALCKSCVQDVDTHSFSYMSKIPKELTQGNVCPTCFDTKVLPHKLKFEETLEKAKDVFFLTKSYKGYVRVLGKHTKRVAVPDCDDRRETIVRLAYFAAELGFNAIIDAEVESKKVVKGKYQSSRWSGSAMPALVDGEQLERSSLRRI
jgi:uncharacterized protein YbjQ (UPF0145 family)